MEASPHPDAWTAEFAAFARISRAHATSPLDIHDWLDPLIRRWLPTLALPGLLPALLLLVASAWLAALALRGRLRVAGWRIGLWTFAVLLPTAAVWTVAAYRADEAWRLQPCTPGVWLHPSMLSSGIPGEIAINVALLVPAGAAAWLWPGRKARLAALLTALATPGVLEAVQYLIPQLHRECQWGDIANNVLGVALGYCLVAGVMALRPNSESTFESGPTGN